MERLGGEARYVLLAIPEGLDPVPMFVLTAASVAVREVIRVVILKGFHAMFSCPAPCRGYSSEYVTDKTSAWSVTNHAMPADPLFPSSAQVSKGIKTGSSNAYLCVELSG